MYNLFLISVLLLQGGSPKVEFFSRETKNFEIICNNKGYADRLAEDIEHIKRSIYLRWGMEDVDFNNKCMLVCVDDPKLYKELYKRDKSVYNANYRHKNKEISAIWFYMSNDWRDSVLSVKLTEACLHEYSLVKNVKFPTWMIVGISNLNGSEKHINNLLKNSYKMMETGFDHYDAESILKQKLDNENYDQWLSVQSTLLCLYLKKELKMKDILSFCRKNSLLVIREDLKFESFEEFNYQFEKYMFNLSFDLFNDKTPATYYLDIFVR